MKIRHLYAAGASSSELATATGAARSTVEQVIKGRVSPVMGAANISRGPGRRRKALING